MSSHIVFSIGLYPFGYYYYLLLLFIFRQVAYVSKIYNLYIKNTVINERPVVTEKY